MAGFANEAVRSHTLWCKRISRSPSARKPKHTGYGGLPSPRKGRSVDLWLPPGSAPAGFAQLANGCRGRYNVPGPELKQALAHVSWKSDQNGMDSPKALLRKAIEMDIILNAPMIAEPPGLANPTLGLSHHLGGVRYPGIAAIAILGLH